MANRLPLPVLVVVMVMVSVLALLLQSSAAAVVPHIEMVRSNDKFNSSSDEDCRCAIHMSTEGFYVGGLDDFTFDVYDKYGNSMRVIGDLSMPLEGFGPCINRPCKLVITEDVDVLHTDLISSVQVIVEVDSRLTCHGTGYNNSATFRNRQLLGPNYSNQVQINNCDSNN